jgi:hypothetical protein
MDRCIQDIWGIDSGHLLALHIADPAQGVQHGDREVVAIGKRFDGR